MRASSPLILDAGFGFNVAAPTVGKASLGLHVCMKGTVPTVAQLQGRPLILETNCRLSDRELNPFALHLPHARTTKA